MKKKKLNLEELKVQSFVTKINNIEKETVRGEIDTLVGCLVISILTGVLTATLMVPNCTADQAIACKALAPLIKTPIKIPPPDINCSVFQRGSCAGTLA